MYGCLKFSSQVCHGPMPHTEFIYFNIIRTKTIITVAYYYAAYV